MICLAGAVATRATATPQVITPSPIREQRKYLLWLLTFRFHRRTRGKAAHAKSVMKENTESVTTSGCGEK